MPYLVALLIIAALVYWLWPIFLATGIALIIVILNNRSIRERNLAAIESVLPQLRGAYVSLYGVQESDPIKCLRIDDIFISGDTKKQLAISFSSIVWDQMISDSYSYKFASNTGTWSLLSIESQRDASIFSLASLSKYVQDFLHYASISIFESSSLESDVCGLMFMNLPEAQWASESIIQINNALDPIKSTYDASLTNELLMGNSSYLLKAITHLENEIKSLTDYAQEACVAMKKIYEFLSVSKSLKNFADLDTKPLQVYSKRQEMQEGFNSAIAIKNEYDNLKA